VDAGISRAVIAVEDPNPSVNGRGIAYLRSHGVEVEVGILAEEARRLNRAFVTYITEGRPFVTIKAALSLDAKVAARQGERTAITGAETAAAVHRERAEIDAIGVGSQTVLVDDPLLTVRGVYRARPLVRVVFDRRLRTPPTARLFSTLDAGPVVIVTTAADESDERKRAVDGIRTAGAEVEIIESEDFLRSALLSLARREVTSLVVEGGPMLQQALWSAGLVDRVELFVASRSLGPEGVDWAELPDGAIASLAELTSTPLGDDVRIEGFVTHVHRPH
jgi:diaminohydroxyphosphoribosylaminopyrimidine deaminase/5-amino-6-(5-phosphoribosylamino)uracil reductase